MKLLIVERFGLMASKLGQRNGCKVANRDLILRRVLKNISAQIGRLDSSQILLIALTIAGILIKHVRCASLDLRVNDLFPEPASFDLLACTSLLLILGVECLKLFTPALE